MFKKYIFILVIVVLAGCARVVDIPKAIWGSSTRALEEARVEAITKTYSCNFRQCYQAVLLVAEEKEFKVFLKDIYKQMIVIMKIPGSVDTTEIGIFFTELNENQVKIYVSSLSSNAKRIVADILFSELDKSLSAAAPSSNKSKN